VQPDLQSGAGSRTILLQVAPNISPSPRSTTVSIAGLPVGIMQSATGENELRRFIRLLYYSFLGRAAADTEVTTHETAGLSRTQLVSNFMGSAEFRLGGRFVAGLYLGLLARDPEFPGWQFQRNAIATGKTNTLSAVSNFLNSPEYANRFGNPSDAQFIRSLYRNILLREPTSAEIDFHAGTLVYMSRAAVALNFLNSDEFGRNTGPRITAFLLSATLQLRDPTAQERNSRTERLETGNALSALTDETLASSGHTALLN
jgi:hypothetical protein